MKQFRYEKLFKPVKFDEKQEKLYLRHLVYNLLEEFDLDSALVIARATCNLSWCWGISLKTIMETVFEYSLIDEDLFDEKLIVMSDSIYNCVSDNLSNVMYVLSPIDIARLRVNLLNIPHKRLDAKFGDEEVVLYFFDSLPFSPIEAVNG